MLQIFIIMIFDRLKKLTVNLIFFVENPDVVFYKFVTALFFFFFFSNYWKILLIEKNLLRNTKRKEIVLKEI